MKLFGNVLWFVLGGVFDAIGLLIAGIICSITIIGIPVGVQLFKLAGFSLWPFGKEVKKVNPNGFKAVLNFFWAISFGWIFALVNAIWGIILCLTVIGIPFGLQYFKIAEFVLLPLGRDFM